MNLNLKKIVTFLFLFLMLNAQSQGQENPVANPNAIVTSGNMRFTVLTPEMIRIEWSDTKQFEDRASFIVVNRNLPVPSFTKETKNGYLYIKTDKLELKYKEGTNPVTSPAGADNLSISFSLDGTTNYWYPGKVDPFNLKGTSRTLDHSSGDNLRGDLENGILSRSGWSLIDESKANGDTSKSLIFERQNGAFDWVAQRKTGNTIDWYFMAYGRDYKKSLLDYTKVAGKMPMPPLYSLGYWYSKYQKYSQQDFIDIVNEIKQHDIPIDVMVVDKDWHKDGWTGWSWNKNLIPDPAGLIKFFHQNHLKTTLNLHPADGVGTHEDNHVALANELGLPTNQTVKWNIENEAFYKAFFKNIMRPHENMGVDFWWLDWQQWVIAPNMKDLGNTFWLNHVFYNDMKINRPDHRPMIFHRWGGLGNHRYPIGFSGDTWATFPTLAYQVYYNSTASNVAYGYWSHDLGGHNQSGANNPELYLRWIQFGIFSPITRTHATDASNIDRRIWKYPNFTSMRDALKIRYAMIPYIYTYSREAYDTGLSLCRPLYYDSPDKAEAYKEETTYMFGDEILVSPIVAAADSKIGTATKQFWMPEGQWTEAATGTVLDGNKRHMRSFAQDEIPFYYKEGAIIPMYPDIKHLKARPDTLIVQFIPGKSGEFRYYEDEGDNDKYKDGKYTTTKITQETTASQGKYTIYPREGSFDNMPSTRRYELRLLSKLPPKKVVVDSKEYPYSAQPKAEYWSYDSKTLSVIINTPSKSCATKVEAVVTYNDNQSASEDLIAGKMGQMTRIIQCRDSLQSSIGNKFPDLFTKMVGTRNRIAANPQNTLTELQDFEKSLEPSIDLLLDVTNAPKEEIKEWKNFILLGSNIAQPNLGESEKNTVPGYNRDGSNLWIAGSAIPGGVAILTEDPTQIAGYFRYHGELQPGEFRIMNTSTIKTGTRFYVPSSADVNVVGASTMQITTNVNAEGWKVTIPDNCYKIKIDAVANTLNGGVFVAREDLFIVGGAVESGWDSGRSLRMKKDIHNPNLFVFSGILKEATSGNDRNMFKLLGQNNWTPISFHPRKQSDPVLDSKYIIERQNVSTALDYKWVVDSKKSGSYVIKVDLFEETITAHNTNLVALYVNGVEWKDLSRVYTLDCSNADTPLKIEIVPLTGGSVNVGTLVDYKATKSGLNKFDFVISSPNGEDKTTYQLKVLKPFAFYDLVTQMWNNTLTVNNNPQNNGGYKFVSFEWTEDGRIIGTKQYYSAGKSSTDLLNKNAIYMVKMKDAQGNDYQTCPTTLTMETLNQFLVYPNPVKVGESVKVETGLDAQQLVGKAQLRVYDLNGNMIRNESVDGNTTSFEVNNPGFYLIQLISNEGIINTTKLLVK